MARMCTCDEFFTTDDDGDICLIPGSSSLRQIIKYSEPGRSTFDKADYPWLGRIRVMVQAAGGGAAGANAFPYAAGGGDAYGVSRAGGAGGGYSESNMISAASLAASVPVIVGAGGTGGNGNNDGTAGGDSRFGTIVTANGGDGSQATMPANSVGFNTAIGVAGPFAGTGFIAIGGGASKTAIQVGRFVFGPSAVNYGVAGAGGDSHLGFGGRGQAVDADGSGPRGFGGGGSGAASLRRADRADGPSRRGGDGGGGIVIVELYA